MGKNGTSKIGSWSFIIGLLICVLGGVLVSLLPAGLLILILGILGILVGLLNITGKETTSFLVAAIALVTASSGFSAVLGSLPNIGDLALGGFIQAVLGNIAVFVAPAALIVALKAIYELAKEE